MLKAIFKWHFPIGKQQNDFHTSLSNFHGNL